MSALPWSLSTCISGCDSERSCFSARSAGHWIVVLLAAAVGFCGTGEVACAQTKAATTTTLTLTSGGSAVTSVAAGTIVTLTASVATGTTALTAGQVNFCDASATHCTDIHLLGMAQLSSAGTALLKFRPGIGSHSYKAIFLGTNTYGGSSSGTASLAVTGTHASTTTITQGGFVGANTLTATVTGIVNLPTVPGPTGTVSFIDTTDSNAVLGTAALGATTAGLSFYNSSNPATALDSIGIATADFNGDGVPDLVVGAGGTQLTVLLGNGDGTFTATATSPTVGAYPYSIAVGDFNGDGIPDLAVGNVDDNTVSILLGVGDGTFTTKPDLSIGGSPQSVAWGDFNEDGIPDLAVVEGTSVLIFLGNGDGTFKKVAASAAAGTFPQGIAVGDFNGDGIADLAVANYTNPGTVTILLGKGDGTFTAAPPAPATGDGTDQIAVADFNGDGIADLAVVNYGADDQEAVDVLIGNGNGTFKAAVPYSVSGFEFSSVVVGDFNRDGIADLVVAGNLNGVPTFLPGNGDGTFGSPVPVQALSGYGSGVLALADFNGDGIPDLAEPELESTTAIMLTQPNQTVSVTLNNVSPAGPGPGQVVATYSGDSNYSGSTSTPTQLTSIVATPVITPASGVYTSVQTVTITDSTPGATIYYGAFGIVKTGGNVQYGGSFQLATGGTETIYAYATAPGYQQSYQAAVNIIVSLPPAPAPALSLASGVYSGTQTVHITDAVSGATIYYTTNGTPPTTYSTPYTGQITISGSEVVSAAAIAPGYSLSPATTAQYLISSTTTSLIYTVAGTEGYGFAGDGGPATFALLNQPNGVTQDSQGNLYIADQFNNIVRKVAAGTGTITTVAGTGIGGYSGDGLAATSAQLNSPRGVALDTAGNLYIADYINGAVRKVAAGTGTISTVAGNGMFGEGGDGGPAILAEIEGPAAVAVDAGGNLYISDENAGRVRKVAAGTGTITTYAGGGTGLSGTNIGDGGPATSASLLLPQGLALDSGGNLYIADYEHQVIREVAASTRNIATVAGQFIGIYYGAYSGDGGPATSAQLNNPAAVAVDSAGNLYIGDTRNYVVRKVTASSGVISTLAGNGQICDELGGDGGPAADVSLCYPQGISVDAAGSLYVAETIGRVRTVTAPIQPPATTAATPTFSKQAGTYPGPQIVSLADATPGAEIYLTLDGTTPSTSGAGYRSPINVNGTATLKAVAVAPGYLPGAMATATYTIGTPPPSVISTVAGSGTNVPSISGQLATSTSLHDPTDVAVDGGGNLYIADATNEVVWKVSADTGTATVVAGILGSQGYGGDGVPATSSQLSNPNHIALDIDGNIYISDDRRVRVVSVASGIINTYAGALGAGAGNIGDGGPATSAYLGPQGLVFDSAGNLYIADSGNGRIRRVNASSGIITTVAGGGPFTGPLLGDGGPATSAALSVPHDLALDAPGNLYIADTGDARVRKVEAETAIISTIAGNGDSGSSGDGLPATQAEAFPYGLAVDGAGDLYISSVNAVRELAAGGTTLTTIAGTGNFGHSGDGGSATLANICQPEGLALDHAGNLYVSDFCRGVIRKVTFQNSAATPVFSPTAGTYASAQPVSISDETPHAVIDYTTDGSAPTAGSTLYNGAITVSKAETLKAVAFANGHTSSGVAAATYTFNPALTAPTVTVTPSASSITTLQPLNVVVAVSGGSGNPTPTGSVTLTGGGYTSAAVTLGGGNATIDVAAGSLLTGTDTLTVTYIPDSSSSLVYSDASGSATVTVMFVSVWIVDGTGGSSELNANGSGMTSGADPGENLALAVDNGGNVWTIGSGTPPLEETSPAGVLQSQVAAGAGGLDLPTAIAIDGDSRVWVANGDNTVSLFTNAGAALSPSTGFTASSLRTPSGIAIDLAGSVWIANKGNNSVTRILGAAAPAAPLATAVANSTTGSKP